MLKLNRHGGLLWSLGAVSVVAFVSVPAAAQTRFEWPDTTVRVAQYTSIEQCLAATIRVRKGQEQRVAATVSRDTMPRDPREALEPPPALATEAAANCAARFTEPTAALDDFAPLLRLYLAAGRDADAAALVTRRLAAPPASATRERTAVGDSAVEIYLAARPVRLDAAEQILLARAHGGADRIARIDLYAKLMNAAQNAGDTARERRAAGWVVAVADSLTKAERESEKFETLDGGADGKILVFAAMRVLTGRSVIYDSLRHGTAALAALERSMWAQATGERPEAMPFPVGVRAPTITADHWFPTEAAGTPHPSPGRVSIVQFFDHDGCLGLDPWGDVRESVICTARLAALRRLSERFPALEIIFATRTHGSFLYAPPPAPAEEAQLIRRWLEARRIHGVVIAVSSTPFWNLPQPDARRIDKETPNVTSYSFGKSWSATTNGFLIDQDGIIVAAPTPEESDLAQMIDVLMQRQQGGAEHAAK